MEKGVARIKKWFLGKKLKQKVRIILIFIIMGYFLVFSTLYSLVIKEYLKDNIKETNYNTIVSIRNNLKNDFESITTMGQLIINNSDILSYLRENGEESLRQYNVISSIYGIETSFKNIASVYIFKLDGEYINIENELTILDKEIIKKKEWYEQIRSKAGSNVIMIDGNGAFIQKSGKPVITFAREINDIQTQKPIGMLVINCSIEMLSDTYREMDDNDKKFSYFDSEGRLICGDIEEGYDSQILENISKSNKVNSYEDKKFNYYSSAIPNSPLIVVEFEKVNSFKYFSKQYILIIVLIILITILSFVAISVFIKHFITNPIEWLVKCMDDVKRVSIQLPDDEMGYLKNSYNNMLVEINKLIEELIEKEKIMQQVELEVLQEQIKPHFLYNTLDTIGYLALDSSGEEVYDAIETLGNFYRQFLSKGDKEITIKDEIIIVKNYLKLQKLRYGDLFEDTYDIDEQLNDVKVPKLILQPLVENSIYHGARLKGEKCIIRISVKEEQDYIALRVYDSGIGMTQEQISSFMSENSKGFGLRKTIERIQHHYGKEDVYEIYSEIGCYCEILIKIPKEGDLMYV